MVVRISPVSVDEYEALSRELLPSAGFATHFGARGAPTWETNTHNLDAFQDWVIRPRILTGVAQPSLETQVLGRTAMPLLLAPAGGQQRFHPEGELATAVGAEQAGVTMALSTLSNFSMEEVAAAAPGGKRWFQLYVLRNREVTRNLAERAEAAGYEAIVLTVDNISGHLARPRRYRLNGISGPADVVWPSLDTGRQLANFHRFRGTPDMPPAALGEFFDPTFAWEDMAWLRSITRLPIILKGVQTAEDAQLAVRYGLDAIIVSNHGGVPTAMDALGATLDRLPEVAAAVAGKIEIYLDGGIRQGSDILKALALGARAVLIGRAALWGLTVGGRDGVRDVVSLLQDELRSAMCIAGVSNLREVSSAILQRSRRRP